MTGAASSVMSWATSWPAGAEEAKVEVAAAPVADAEDAIVLPRPQRDGVPPGLACAEPAGEGAGRAHVAALHKRRFSPAQLLRQLAGERVRHLRRRRQGAQRKNRQGGARSLEPSSHLFSPARAGFSEG
jgi:hypothetical protein